MLQNPVFSPAQIKGLAPIFFRKSRQLRDLWTSKVAEAKDGTAVIDVLPWISRAALDVIGEAGE